MSARACFSFAILAAAILDCAGQPNESTYTEVDQDRQVSRVTGRYRDTAGTLTIDVCEDDASSTQVSDCLDSYVLQSGGKGRRISNGDQTGGCGSVAGGGGCPENGVVLPIKGSITEGGATATVFAGLADWGSDDGSSLDRDLTVTMNAGTAGAPTGLRGTLAQDGSLTVTRQDQSTATTETTLTRVGVADCSGP
jgi:hypothetical protein